MHERIRKILIGVTFFAGTTVGYEAARSMANSSDLIPTAPGEDGQALTCTPILLSPESFSPHQILSLCYGIAISDKLSGIVELQGLIGDFDSQLAGLDSTKGYEVRFPEDPTGEGEVKLRQADLQDIVIISPRPGEEDIKFSMRVQAALYAASDVRNSDPGKFIERYIENLINLAKHPENIILKFEVRPFYIHQD